MKKFKLSKAILLLAICFGANMLKAQPSTTALWSKQWNDAISVGNHDDYGMAVYTDDAHAWVAGRGNFSSGFDNEVVVIKYDKSGTAVWTTTVNPATGSGSCVNEGGYAIAVDGSGYVWVAAGIVPGGGTNSNNLALIKLSSGGAVQSGYPKYWGTNNCGTNGMIGLCLAISGTSVYIGGSYYNGTNYSFVVLKDSTTGWGWGNTAYSYSTGAGNKEARCMDLKVNSNNTSVYATGWVTNSNNDKDAFTVGLNATNKSTLTGWPQTYNNSNSTRDEMCNVLSIEPSGTYIYVAGYQVSATTGKDGLLIKYSTGGATQTGFPATYDEAGHDDAWIDMETVSPGTSTAPAVYVGGYAQDAAINSNYCLAAYKDNGGLAKTGYWTTDPVHYDGAYNSGGSGRYGHWIFHRL